MKEQYGDYHGCNTEDEIATLLPQVVDQALGVMLALDFKPSEVGKIELFITELPKEQNYKYSVGWKFSVKEED